MSTLIVDDGVIIREIPDAVVGEAAATQAGLAEQVSFEPDGKPVKENRLDAYQWQLDEVQCRVEAKRAERRRAHARAQSSAASQIVGGQEKTSLFGRLISLLFN